MSHSNWLRNRLPAKRINNQIPILKWNEHTVIDFKNLLEFGTPGYAFIYYSDTVGGKKFLPRSIFCYFVGIESNNTLIRAFVPMSKSIIIIRRQDFHIHSNKLPGVESLIDGIARQIAHDTNEKGDEEAEKFLHKVLLSTMQYSPYAMSCLKQKEWILEYLHPSVTLANFRNGERLLIENIIHSLNAIRGHM